MSETPTKAYWMGRDLETLSKEELIEICKRLHSDLEHARTRTDSVAQFYRIGRLGHA